MKRILCGLSVILFSSNVFASYTLVGKLKIRRAPISNSDGISYWLIAEEAIAELGLPRVSSLVGLRLSSPKVEIRQQIKELAENCQQLAAGDEGPEIEVVGEIKKDIFDSHYLEVESIKQK